MNHAMLQRIVEEVAARLRRRALSTATLSVAQLGEADIRSLLCQHASLRIVQVDLPLLEQLTGQRALTAAVRACHGDAARLLLAKGADTLKPAAAGTTPLMLAAARCNPDVVRAVANHRPAAISGPTANGKPAGIDAVDALGRTALWHAADRGNTAAVGALLALGATPTLPDSEGRSPLLRALEAGHAGVAAALLPAATDVEQASKSGNTALMLAARSGAADVVERLLTMRARKDTKNARGETALMLAAREGHAGVVARLIAAGADRGLRNKRRETASDIARLAGNTPLVSELEPK